MCLRSGKTKHLYKPVTLEHLPNEKLEKVANVASRYERHELIEYLLSCPGVDVNARNPDNSTPLILASAHGHTAVVARLLQDDRMA